MVEWIRTNRPDKTETPILNLSDYIEELTEWFGEFIERLDRYHGWNCKFGKDLIAKWKGK